MKSFIIISLAFFFLTSCKETRMPSVRERVSFDFDWRFIQEDVTGAERYNFDDSQWRLLDVPHDWSIEGRYDANNPSGTAGAFLPTGIGWYRKELIINSINEEDKYFIEFDGIYMNSDVWINGHHLGNRPYGYISFYYDLSDYLKEGKNILAVRVDNSKTPSGRWYTGSGIYRHVWLTKTKNVYIPQWGTKINSSNVTYKGADVNFVCVVNNESGTLKKIEVVSSIYDMHNELIARSASFIKTSSSTSVNQEFHVVSPLLWSPSSPNMYNMKTDLIENGKILDTYSSPFGIRSIEVRGSSGFFLNGKSIKFKGLSNHHDAGPVGSAVPDDVLYSRLKLLKEMGCNALRTTHNPFSPTFYTMCDTMGFMVMNEAFDGWWKAKAEYDYGNYFEEWWQLDLKDFIERDYNHPSVVIWSIGNEVPNFKSEEQKLLVDFVSKIDSIRPVTQGRGYMAPYLDISGFNGHGEFKGTLENYHKNHPDKAIVGTEITHTLQTRGIYRTKTWYRAKDNPAPWEKPDSYVKMEHKIYKIKDFTTEEVFEGVPSKYQSSYDNSIVRIGVREDWNRVEEWDYYIGNFRWTGFDYLGESFGWPARTANFGIIDLAGFPKDHYYLYQSLWSDKPMVHVLPHWTHPGKEGIKIPVVVYTNCESVELFLNGQSLGEKLMTKDRQLVWLVPYSEGELKVLARSDGKVVARETCTTAQKAFALNTDVDKKIVRNNRTDIIQCKVTVVDRNGVMIPNANNLVEFEVNGPAKLIGVENGDILDLNPHKVNYRKVFNGMALLLLQSTDEIGDIQVIAKSKGLKEAVVNIESR